MYLDGLRGLLAVVVFVHHFFYAFYPDLVFGGSVEEYLHGSAYSIKRILALTPLNIFFNPGMAINFFFLLSGYVQTIQYMSSGNIKPVQQSFLKRYFRLAIPTLVVVLLVFFFHKLNWIHKDYIPQNRINSEWSRGVLPDNLGFFQAVLCGAIDCFYQKTAYYSVLWTMPYELYGSFSVLILLMATHLIKNKKTVFLLWLFFQLFFIRSYIGAAFTVGLLLAYAEVNEPKFGTFFSRKPVRFFCFLVGLYFATYPYTAYEGASKKSVYALISFFDKYPHVISHFFGDVLLFVSLLYSKKAQGFLSASAFLFLGKISFMLYLTHFLVVFSFSPWLYIRLLESCSHDVSVSICGLLTFGLTVLISWILYRIVDKPSLDFCNRKTAELFKVAA